MTKFLPRPHRPSTSIHAPRGGESSAAGQGRALHVPDAYVRELLASCALQHAPTVSGLRETGLMWSKLLRWYQRYGTLPTTESCQRIARNLAIDLIRRETGLRVDAAGATVGGARRGLTFVSLDVPGEGCSPGSPPLHEALAAPAPALDPREAWEYQAATLIAAALGKKMEPRDRTIIARVLFGGEPAVALAHQHGLTESRISQILRRARLRLRTYLAAA